MAQLLGVLKQRFSDSNGDPFSGGLLYSYEAGTSTPLATYTDQGAGTENDNPVVLDSDGYADVWLGSSAYKFVLKDSDLNTILTVDNVSSIQDGEITTVKIADSNITTVKIADSNITTAKIADSNITTAKIANGAVTAAKLYDRNYAKTGPDTTAVSSGSDTTITGLNTSLTTNGRPVLLYLEGDISINTPGGTAPNVKFYRDTTLLETYNPQPSSSSCFVPGSCFQFLDVPSAGTYTYSIKLNNQSATSISTIACYLIAMEL